MNSKNDINIVLLDGFALNPGDFSWEKLEQLGNLTVYDRSAPETVFARSEQADILLTNKTVLDAAMLGRLTRLKFISVLATGWNVVDTVAAAERGIGVSNVPGYSTESVVASTIGHLLNLAGRLAEHAERVRAGDWATSTDFCFYRPPLVELAGKTLGIVGFGTIGGRVAAIAQSLQMRVIAYGPRRVVGDELNGVRFVELDQLFAESDAVSLHCPLSDTNRLLVNAERLAQMKPGAFLINTARGPLIDESALAAALFAGRLGGAGLDVLTSEPPDAKNRLFSAPNCFITPHIAWATVEARHRLMATTVANVQSFLAGSPQNLVNKPVENWGE